MIHLGAKRMPYNLKRLISFLIVKTLFSNCQLGKFNIQCQQNILSKNGYAYLPRAPCRCSAAAQTFAPVFLALSLIRGPRYYIGCKIFLVPIAMTSYLQYILFDFIYDFGPVLGIFSLLYMLFPGLNHFLSESGAVTAFFIFRQDS